MFPPLRESAAWVTVQRYMLLVARCRRKTVWLVVYVPPVPGGLGVGSEGPPVLPEAPVL